MTDTELKIFFDEYRTISILIRSRKIFELTNGFDVYLLKTLKHEFTQHYLQKAFEYFKELEGIKKVELPAEFDNIHNNAHSLMYVYLNERNENILSEMIDFYIGEIEFELVKHIFEDEVEFLYEIDEIIRYKENVRQLARNQNDSEEIDLVDYDNETLVSKILFLHQTGIIDELRKKEPFNTSINSLANLISALTGGKTSSIQPMLNAMLSNNVNERNNPLNSIKTLNIVKKKLADIGYKI
jgi:hypothetical protein